jgi:hypothetical protein
MGKIVAGCLVGCGLAAAAPPGPNMNGAYLLSQTPGGNRTQERFPTTYANYPRAVESFDVYSPLISSLYSQVFWKGLDPVALPDAIVKKYAGKGMAVVGFEMDQVRKTADGDVSVPINVAYNHHFESSMVGGKARFEKVKFSGPDDPRLRKLLASREMGHGVPSLEEAWLVEEPEGGDPSGLPTSVALGGANGGEYRKSFHGYAPGYAHLIQSPTSIQITPMQIDTFNRDKMNISHPSRFVPGAVSFGFCRTDRQTVSLAALTSALPAT